MGKKEEETMTGFVTSVRSFHWEVNRHIEIFLFLKMQYDPLSHNRRSTRLRGHDYSRAGIYFVTICTNGRECLFGEIINEEMRLNQTGKIVEEEWLKTKEIRPNVELDDFVVMPNHVHAILIITNRTVGAYGDMPLHESPCRVAPTEFRSPSHTIGAIIRGFKGASTKRINETRGIMEGPIWQRNFLPREIFL